MSNINVNNITPLAGTSGTVSISGSLHVRNNISANGTLTFGDANTDNISLNAEFTSSMIPDLNNKFDIGTSAKQWKTLHIATASIGGVSSSLIPDKDNIYDLGSSGKEYKDLFIDGVAKIDALGSAAGDTSIAYISELSGSGTLPNITASVNIIPKGDSVYNLGEANNEWKDLFIDGVAKIDALGSVAEDTSIAYIKQLSGSAAQASITSSVNIVPGVDNTYSLGETGKEFKDLFINGVAKIDALGSVAGDTAIAYISELSGSGALPNLSASVNIIPKVDSTYDLGESANAWKDLYADNINITKATAASADSATYTVNGSKVEVRTQLQAQLNDGTFAAFTLQNTSISTDSVVIGAFTGGTVGAITASFISANTIAASTASFRIHNETGGNIANDTGFTASFVVL
jgi:hypothetical protein